MSGSIIIDRKSEALPDIDIKIKLGDEVHHGEMMQNADGEIFYKTVKIAEVRKAGIIKRFLARMKGRK